MSELAVDRTESLPPVVQFAPPDIARGRFATWNGIQTDAVEVVRRARFEYDFRAPRHLLVMCERAERDEGETVVEGLPKSTLHELSRTMSFVPAGHRYSGWQKPRTLARVTYFYIDPSGPLIDPELHFAEADFKPRLYFFDKDLWETAQKLKAQAGHSGPADRQFAEALSIVLAHELLRVNNGGVTATHRIRGGLAGWQEKRVAQFIEEHLAEDPSLATLADVARLSPVPLRTGIQAIVRSAAAPLHEQASRRASQGSWHLLWRVPGLNWSGGQK
jgi:hypothetical protein